MKTLYTTECRGEEMKMALITCIECGKEFSDKANCCPNCSCPTAEIIKHLKENFYNNIDYEIDNDKTKCKACLNCGAIYFDVSAMAYIKGYCIECRGANLYDKLIKIDYSTDEFLRIIGKSPSAYNYVENQKWIRRIYDTERVIFEKYVKDWKTLDKDSKTYRLNIENLYKNGQGEIHTEIQEVAQKKAEELRNKVLLPKCPTCQNTSIRKIGNVKKSVSVAIFGIFSNDIGKTFECIRCGCKW